MLRGGCRFLKIIRHVARARINGQVDIVAPAVASEAATGVIAGISTPVPDGAIDPVSTSDSTYTGTVAPADTDTESSSMSATSTLVDSAANQQSVLYEAQPPIAATSNAPEETPEPSENAGESIPEDKNPGATIKFPDAEQAKDPMLHYEYELENGEVRRVY